MPQRRAAQKALRQNQRKKIKNLKVKREIKTALKEFRKALDKKDSQAAEAALPKVYKTLDKAASKKVIHRNKASRKKSRLAQRLKKSAQASA